MINNRNHSAYAFSRKGLRSGARSVKTIGRPLLVLMLVVLGLTFAWSGNPQASGVGQSKGGEISESAARQIQALLAEKASRTPAQRKIDSNLIYATKASHKQSIAQGVDSLETNSVTVEPDGRTIVDITTGITPTEAKLVHAALDRMNIEVISAVGNGIRAKVTFDDLEPIASLPQVRFIMPKQEAKFEGSFKDRVAASFAYSLLPALRPGFAERADRVRTQLISALAGLGQKVAPPPKRTAAVNVSEGDATHKAATGRTTFGVNGTGVKVGVLSDGVASLAAVQGTGDLGPVTVLPGQAGSGNEGTAMLEIVHDLAPGAQLFFATANTGITTFAQNIRDLRTAGCDIIVDDVIYFVESPMQDGQAASVTSPTNGGVVIQAVNDVTTAGAMYFSSAGNEGNLNDGTASVWEGDFVDGGANALIPGGTVHSFGGGNLNDQITTAGARALLFWSDPLGASSNDYDLFALNSTATAVVASSTNIQDGNDDPVEDAGNRSSGQRLVILKKTGAAARFLHLTCFGAEMAIVTNGTTHGHSHALNAFSVAATPAASTPFGGPPGPFPGPFVGTNVVETFSSDGPRRLLYNADSTPITPGNVSSTGGVVRQKPDITAADGVSCAAPGFSTFFGTSAAAPHAAAIAALVKSVSPALTPAQIKAALLASAIDIEAAGTDRDSGAGIVMAFEAIQAGGGTPSAVIVSAGATLTSETCSPANGALDPGETVTVSLCLQNTGGANTTALQGTLQATGGVTAIQAPNPQNYGVVVAGGPAVCRDFTFTASGTCGSTLTATLALTDGAASLGNVTYTFTLGSENVAFTENFDGVTAPNLPAGWTSATTNGDGDCTVGGPLCALGSNWTTVSTSPDTAPNAAFHNDPSCVTNNTLDTPSIAITSASSTVTFRNNFNTESTFDGGVLEISVGGGPFTDIVTAGGSFVTGGYNGTISVNFLSPIAGRQAWTGNSGGFITTTANLPASANGQNVVIRFRMASDCSVGATGWTIDTIKVSSGFVCAACAQACVITCPANITKSNDPNQCGAVVTYPAPTSTGTCGTITCVPPSGSFFPVGTTSISCVSAAQSTGPSGGGCTTITESSSQAITPLNSVSCNNGVGHTDNSYYRAFTLSSFGIVAAFDVQSVDIGIEAASSGGTVPPTSKNSFSRSKGTKSSPSGVGGQPITVNIYTSSQPFPTGFPGSLTLIGTTSTTVNDQSGTIINVPITGTAPAGSQLVVEVFTPDGEAAGNLLFIGSNASPETGPSYLRAASCGVNNPTPTASIGFPNMHIVMNVNGCEQSVGTGPTCSFTVTVNDTQPPVITCPADVTVVTDQSLCTGAGTTCQVANFTTTASDNCPGVTVLCNPPSGSCFPVGVTTVTCTATDVAGNTATCSFSVTTFDVLIQDDGLPQNSLAWNSLTGAYRFCCNGTVFIGTGKATKQGCVFTLQHNPLDRRVLGRVDKATHTASGSLQAPAGTVRCTIIDRNTLDDTNLCGVAPPPK